MRVTNLHSSTRSDDRTLAVEFLPPGPEARPVLQVRSRMAARHGLSLSSAINLLALFEFHVDGELTRAVGGTADFQAWESEFVLVPEHTRTFASKEVCRRVEQAIASAWEGSCEADEFSSLVVRTGCVADELEIVRTYAGYIRQVGPRVGMRDIAQALGQNPTATRALVHLFRCRFDPDLVGSRSQQIDAASKSLITCLDQLAAGAQDKVLRRMSELIHATVRTNFYQLDAEGVRKEWMSIKLNSRAISDLPDPRPLYEVFVRSRWMEGIHLRSAKVSRGGIRWSDRNDDFRLEIHGLLKAQIVKNVVIVPEGSKGGFVVRGRAHPSETRTEAAMRAYRTLMCGLLDVTDNIKTPVEGAPNSRGTVVPPPRGVRHDDDDPYLVVAADKGTAAFSDIANDVAASYGFWLGDAFASGGSNGYDHKKLGITAKGAWLSVLHHLSQIDVDATAAPVRTVAVGDMSGDVFGNGMLQSKNLRLVAAFDHRHIFIDPSPPGAEAWEERRRLYSLANSSWADYRQVELSKGGQVIGRHLPRCNLTEEAAAALGLEPGETTPSRVIRAILTAQVDLVWFGGIGTYVKGSKEAHSQIGDSFNDDVRVDASALRAIVVAEGANLAMTQAARVEASLTGVRLNTDAIDNSAGVSCSDHEVNIKIALHRAVRAHSMTHEQRNSLLRELTPAVVDLVLADNEQQNLALSLAEREAPKLLSRHLRLVQRLEASGELDRRVAGLPMEDEFEERRARGGALSRPELALLLAHTKLSLTRGILSSDLPDQHQLDPTLLAYFPKHLQERFEDILLTHPLRREIITTCIVNSMVNRMGSGFVHAVQERVRCDDAAVARAYMVVQQAFDLDRIWQEAVAVPADWDSRYSYLTDLRRAIEHAVSWLLRWRKPWQSLPKSPMALREAIVEAQSLLAVADAHELSSASSPAQSTDTQSLARIAILKPAFEVALFAVQSGLSVRTALPAYMEGKAADAIRPLRNALESLVPKDNHERRLRDLLEHRLAETHVQFASIVLRGARTIEIDFDVPPQVAGPEPSSLAQLAAAALELPVRLGVSIGEPLPHEVDDSAAYRIAPEPGSARP